MKLYNSLTHKLEEFKPLRPKQASLYTCGPTVYDHVQIGNLRTFIFEDLLRRILKANGYEVQHVMNITDVDDKTIKRSRADYPDDEPMAALRKLTKHYEELFYKDAAAVGIDLSDSKIVKATDHIADMQKLIAEIPNKYVTDDGVYYDINQDKNYGVLVKLDRHHQHHRINNDEYDKEHVADFALWKAQNGDEPAWEFELDGHKLDGRPGWHIECSAMSVKYLGQPFDIHTGGIDLAFPHHENEIAQSRAATGGKSLANYFVHGEHLLVDGHKMSKSLKNYFTLKDLEERGYDPLAFRLLVLQSHYRGQTNFTWESLSAAQANLRSLQAWADQSHQDVGKITSAQIDKFKQTALDALADDLGSPEALAALNQLTGQGAPSNELLKFVDKLLGLNLAARQDITTQQKELIKRREDARQKSDWEKSDKLRDELKEQGIELNDTLDRTIWARL